MASSADARLDESAIGATPAIFDNLFEELNERERRRSNLMIFNVPESQSADVKVRVESDLQAVKQIMNVLGVTVEIRGVIRIGRRGGTPRPLKLLLSTRDDVLGCLRNRNRLEGTTYQIGSDLTQKQRLHMKGLKTELKRRVDSGERDLTIRYTDGVPKIIRKSVRKPKN